MPGGCMSLRWSLRTRENATLVVNDEGFEVISNTNSHFYVLANKDSGDFKSPPQESIVAFEQGQRVAVSAKVAVTGAAEAAWVLVTYGAKGSKSTLGGPTHAETDTGPDTTFVTAALRIKGIGRIVVDGVRTSAASATPIAAVSKVAVVGGAEK